MIKFLLILLFCLVSNLSAQQIDQYKKGILDNAEHYLDISTFDGSDQAVHPDVLYLANGLSSYKYWMGITPYPFGNRNFENPSILASNDGIHWKEPAYNINPLTVQPDTIIKADSDILFNPLNNEINYYYVQGTLTENEDYKKTGLCLITSADGIHWGNSRLLFEVEPISLISPTIIFLNNKFTMWSVNAAYYGPKSPEIYVERWLSDDGLEWTKQNSVLINQTGCKIWHIDVQYVQKYNKFIMLFCAFDKRINNPNSSDLYFADSKDGIIWNTYPCPIISKSYLGWDNQTLYRSTSVYFPGNDLLKIWYSGMNSFNEWRVGKVETELAVLENELQHSIPESESILKENNIKTAFPNPFNRQVMLKFQIYQSELAKLEIFNILGQHIRTLFHRTLHPAEYKVLWNGQDEFGNIVASGTYIFILRINSNIFKKKITFIK